MVSILVRAATATLLLVTAGLAQTWEVGGMTGGGFHLNPSVSSPLGSATAGFRNGPVFGGYLGHNMYRTVSGELHYSYSSSDLKVAGSGQDARFSGEAHAVHYDCLFHTAPQEARTRPFVVVGGGVKVFRGTGTESAYQKLQHLALLTRTHQAKPLFSVGAGARIVLAPRMWLRVEFRDQITPFPKEVVAPGPGAKMGGWLHDFVPMVGLVFGL